MVMEKHSDVLKLKSSYISDLEKNLVLKAHNIKLGKAHAMLILKIKSTTRKRESGMYLGISSLLATTYMRYDGGIVSNVQAY